MFELQSVLFEVEDCIRCYHRRATVPSHVGSDPSLFHPFSLSGSHPPGLTIATTASYDLLFQEVT
jgi:hypothetical protein